MLDVIEHGPVRELRLNRPPVNALDGPLLERLGESLDQAVAAGAGAVVLSGQPGIFSAGLDVRALLSLDRAAAREYWRFLFDVQAKLARLPIPCIAAITGHCPAGGTVLALYCDYRVMAAGSWRIGLNEVQVGLYPGPILYRVYARLLGTHRAAELLARGGMLEPEPARAAGLVDEVRPPEEVVERAKAYAGELVRLPRQAYARTRALVRADLAALFDGLDESLYDEANEMLFNEETRARIRSLLERGR